MVPKLLKITNKDGGVLETPFEGHEDEFLNSLGQGSPYWVVVETGGRTYAIPRDQIKLIELIY